MTYETVYLTVYGGEDDTNVRIDGVPSNVVESLRLVCKAVDKADWGGGIETIWLSDGPRSRWEREEFEKNRFHWDDLTREKE